MAREFVPFGGGQAESAETPKFIRRETPGMEPDELDEPVPTPVTPAEAVDLAGRIRQILDQAGGMNAEAAAQAATEIEAAVAAAPARVALPEIKVTPPAPAPAEEGAEDSEAPQIPTIELERDGETVQRIRVGCTCGETILLDCDY